MGTTKIKSVEDNIEKLKEETAEAEEETPTQEATPTEEPKEAVKPKKSGKKPKKGHKIRSEKYLEATKDLDKNEFHSIPVAVELAQKTSYSKYPGSLEIHVVTNIKNLRGLVNLPYAAGKQIKILAFGKGADESDADLVGDDAKLAEIAKGRIDFDVLITTPDWMPRLAALAKVLGPKGLMPNPKNGTITDNLKKAVSELQTGKTEYRTESNGKVLHLSLGKINQPSEELTENVKTLLTTIGKSKVKKAVLSPTLGPGIKINLASI